MKKEEINTFVERIKELEKENLELKGRALIPLLEKLTNETLEELKKESDHARLEVLHNRLQRYIELGIKYNESVKF